MTEPAPMIEILLVEDSEADAELTRELLSRTRERHRIHCARDGIDALRQLRGGPDGAGALHPNLILLDLNLPRLGGLELLAVLKQDPRLCTIPVVVLTMSDLENDVQQAYASQAAAFVTKPVGLAQFRRVMQALDAFWLGSVRFAQPGDRADHDPTR